MSVKRIKPNIELKQGRGQSPSPQILTSLARALRLDTDGSAHLLHLAGHQHPLGAEPAGMQRALAQLLDLLHDTPAMVMTDLHEILVQNPLCEVLIGVHAGPPGPEASFVLQWFIHPEVQALYPSEDHAYHSRLLVSDLQAAAARRQSDAATRVLLTRLRQQSAEFTELWDRHDISVPHEDTKRIVSPALGVVEVSCNSFYTADAAQRVLWMAPVDDNHLRKLRALSVQDVWGAAASSQVTPAPNPAGR
ncbi:transcriptional regulator [Streptomyces sp. PSKA30]|uniref:MmyB family transcriptional regulator n=1 Tax=Streptomyces sp. PSKA30 TaxID=2874597 RepID=UPI001CD0DEB6|nr:transcriptional regulator [Streptomyces sp. PSKA30]MBZ9645038.1 transcriptional regulator [Streptomyces sp. PSKA30]